MKARKFYCEWLRLSLGNIAGDYVRHRKGDLAWLVIGGAIVGAYLLASARVELGHAHRSRRQ